MLMMTCAKANSTLGQEIAHLAQEEYQIEEVLEDSASQETWGQFVEIVSHKNMLRSRIKKNPFTSLKQ